MSFVTLDVDIDHGRIVPRDPEKVPESGVGVLTIYSAEAPSQKKQRVRLPLIQGDGKNLINPTAQELDASLWGE